MEFLTLFTLTARKEQYATKEFIYSGGRSIQFSTTMKQFLNKTKTILDKHKFYLDKESLKVRKHNKKYKLYLED
jgi:hypothetical protein